jgi:predicted enzyme related to lactoylglutathione lyase
MHKSRLAGFIIDCKTRDLEGATRFWSAALGLPSTGSPTDDPGYRRLGNAPGGLHVAVQQVTHESRVHLDIETDNIDAEARRLEALGARRVAAVQSWIVMEAPTGQRLCILPPQSPEFAQRANRWA